MNTSAWVPTACYQCKAECPILVRVEDGKVKEIWGNPKAHGKACVKGMAGIALEYSPDRLLYPMKRVGKRGEGKFERISWDEVLDILTEKLRDLKDRGEAHKLTANFFPHSITDPKWRFLNAYGGFINTALPHCDSAKIVAFIKAMGGVPNHHIKPGGDTAFFLGMIHHIVTQDLYDKEFVEKWVREGDFDKLKGYIADKTPEKVSEICDVAPEVIKQLAEECAKAPSVGVDSFKGIMLGQALDFGHAW